MGTKNKPGKFDCYAKAHSDEPMFVLLGRDPLAADLVRRWAYLREQAVRGVAEKIDAEKIAEAVACADDLQEWAKLPHHKAHPGDVVVAYDGLVPVDYLMTVSGVAETKFKGMGAESVPGVDYGAFAIYNVFAGCMVPKQWYRKKLPQSATALFESWDSPMDVIPARGMISIVIKNVSEIPQKFAVKIVGLSSEEPRRVGNP